MTEEIKTDHTPAIKTLFAQLLTLIMKFCTSGEKVYEMVTVIGSWASVVLGSLVLMVEQKDQERTFVVIDRITEALNRDIKKHCVLLRGLKQKSKSDIIVPEKGRIIT